MVAHRVTLVNITHAQPVRGIGEHALHAQPVRGIGEHALPVTRAFMRRSPAVGKIARMFKQLLIFGAFAALAAACAGESGAAADPKLVPTGATIEPSGFATILDVPPAPFAAKAPGAPEPPSAEQVAAQEQFRRVAEWQNSVRDEVDALHRKLDRLEKGNFVDLYFENEGEPHVVFRFLRDPEETLAKYTSHTRFRAAKAGYTTAELAAALDFMMKTFAEERIIMGGGYGNKENRATVEIAIPEEEFRELVERKGVKIPAAVRLVFRAQARADDINRPLPAAIAPLVRIFPRDDRPVGAVNSINSYAKVVLQDGCFRASDQDNALVLFPLGVQLFVDSQGYLAFGSEETPGYARVGQEIVFMGSIAEVAAPELVRPIHAACGPGKVIKVNGMRSAATERAQDQVTTNVNAFRELKQMYGLSDSQASRAFEKCKQQAGFGTCLLSPPPPVDRQQDCPAGTTLSYGLCRTPEGHIRPLPKWLEEFAGSGG